MTLREPNNIYEMCTYCKGAPRDLGTVLCRGCEAAVLDGDEEECEEEEGCLRETAPSCPTT